MFGGLTLALAVALLVPLSMQSTSSAAPATAAPVSPTPAKALVNDPRAKTVTAFLNTHCVSCHNPEKKKADLVLHTYADTSSILKGRKVVQHALAMVKSGEMPPDSKPQPKVEEIEAFAAAVNGMYADDDRLAGPNPGRVTVRRLNKNEYNNTVSDLLGMEFLAADDFPADDIGHGFDNIGDVLTLSPVLMERYLAAAEVISQKAIVLEPPKVGERWQGGRYLEPAGRRVPTTKFRPVTKGAVNTPFRLSNDGDYVFRTRVYARTTDGEPVKATLLLDGKELSTHEVTGKDEKSAKIIEHRLHLEPREYRFAVQIANPSPGAEELDIGNGRSARGKIEDKSGEARPADGVRVLYVEFINVNGPEDTRPSSHRRLIAAADPKAPKATQTRQIMERLTLRAYRRPPTKDEVDRLCKLVEQTEAAGEKWEAGLQMALQAVLVSPKFLFRLELDDRPEAAEPRPLDEFQLASRLSYFVWASMPDDELLDLAAKKQLTPNLDAQVRRMLKSPRAQTLVDNFAMQWLQLKRLKTFSPDPNLFPKFDETLRNSMQQETELFLTAILQEDRSILDLIDADFTFLNDRLAAHYGITDTLGNGWDKKPGQPRGERIPYGRFVRVSLPKGGARGGLLTQASILAVTSNPSRTSPVKRGKWVLEQILGAPPPPAPPNVPELEATSEKAHAKSLRQQMEQHRENPACANCHAKMDPIGFAFENFDAVGAYRWKDGNSDIDASGVLPDGSSFKGAAELRSILVQKRADQFTKCVTEKLMIYALGRGLEYYDDGAVTKVTKAVAADNHKLSRLVIEIVKCEPFRMRRGLQD
ncbi:DUF1592 domain-containing protein [Humisphaera borealis]|nr:DUF1592 domain-containing protein [Humisphaera borealis]